MTNGRSVRIDMVKLYLEASLIAVVLQAIKKPSREWLFAAVFYFIR